MKSRQLQIAPPFAEQVIAYIKEQLFSGDLKPGQRLSEVELAQSLGISRSPIREALQRLVNEGLVELVPNKGAFIASFTPDELRELYEVREALEGMAAGLAASHATAKQLAKLEALLEATEAELGQAEGYPYPGSLDFHGQLIELAGNSKLREKIAEISVQIRLARSLSGAVPKRAAEAYQEHLAVLNAIKAHDAAAAERAMRRHIVNSRESTLAILAEEAKPVDAV